MMTDESEGQSRNADAPMLVTLPCISIEVMPPKPQNAKELMAVISSGTTMLVTFALAAYRFLALESGLAVVLANSISNQSESVGTYTFRAPEL